MLRIGLFGVLVLFTASCAGPTESADKVVDVLTADKVVIPAQVLRLRDASEQEVGTLRLAIDGVVSLTTFDALGHSVFELQVASKTRKLSYFGPGPDPLNSFLIAMIGQNEALRFELKTADGPFREFRSKSADNLSPADEYPPKKPDWELHQLVPTEDVRLADRNGRVFAILGLSANGQPSVVLMDENRIAAWWLVAQPSILAVFDDYQSVRLNLKFVGTPMPYLEVLAGVRSYYIDPTLVQEVRYGPIGGEMLWLGHPTMYPTEPVQLLDQRLKVLWSAP